MKKALKPLIAEFIGVYMLVFAGCGAIVINALTSVGSGGGVGHVAISLTFGLVIMVMIYAVGHISGAHFNPAVTIAFTATRHFSPSKCVLYIAAQVSGAVFAAATLRMMFGNVANLGTTLPSGLGAFSPYATASLMEFILTFALMFVIMAVAKDTRAVGQMAGIAIGGTVALEALFAGPVSGASMNPARSLGPALISGELDYLTVYLLFPIAGALAGAFVYRAICGCGEDGQPPC